MFKYLNNLKKNFKANRQQPPLSALQKISSAAKFLTAILPYVSRTFSIYINLNPGRLRLPLGVGYCYCRALDFFEDALGLTDNQRLTGLKLIKQSVVKNSAQALSEAQQLAAELKGGDEEDQATLVLIQKLDLINRLKDRLSSPQKLLLEELVCEMSQGMQWNIATLAAEGGQLKNREQTEKYCIHVAGIVGLFIDRLVSLETIKDYDKSAERVELNYRLGRLLQLTNIARDLAEDINNNRIYDYRLYQKIKDLDFKRLDAQQQQKILGESKKEINQEIEQLFSDLEPFISLQKHKFISRTRGALFFPFILAKMLQQGGTDREDYLYTGKEMVRKGMSISFKMMYRPNLCKYANWTALL